MIGVRVSGDLCNDCSVCNDDFITRSKVYDISVGIILAADDSCDALI